MSTEQKSRTRGTKEIPMILGCDDCDVTWRDYIEEPCWICGGAGHVVKPERLVFD